jgi:hypothetical protein
MVAAELAALGDVRAERALAILERLRGQNGQTHFARENY